MMIRIVVGNRSIMVETDFHHSDNAKNREIFDRMYADCIKYILTGEKQK